MGKVSNGIGVAAALFAVAAQAGPRMCASGCSVDIAFGEAGGVLSTTQGATVRLGAGGSVDLAGGAIVGGTHEVPEAGSETIVLDAGGRIEFGPGGALRTGSDGDVELTEGSEVDLDGATVATVSTPGVLRLGRIASSGAMHFEVSGSFTGGDTSTPIDLNMLADDPDTQLSVTAADVSYETFVSTGDGGGDGGTGTGASEDCTTDPGSSGSLTASRSDPPCTTSGGSIEAPPVELIEGSGELVSGRALQGGALQVWALILMGFLGLMRRP